MRILLVALVAACASTPRAAPKPCLERLVAYRDWPALEASGDVRWELDLAAQRGRLRYLGAEHSDDPAHPQFAAIDRAWAALRPTVAFYEGPDRPLAATREETIRTTGESGYVRFLARRDGIPALRLDPDPRAEANAMLARHPRDQVLLFYVLREAVRLRDRKGVPAAKLAEAVSAMLAQAARLQLDMFASIAELEAAYRVHLGDPRAWQAAPAAWFTPLPRDTELFTHHINRDSSELRNRHMATQLTAHARAGERVFAVVGKHHVPMQEPALRCALASPLDRRDRDRGAALEPEPVGLSDPYGPR